jgi:hypothetical protein
MTENSAKLKVQLSWEYTLPTKDNNMQLQVGLKKVYMSSWSMSAIFNMKKLTVHTEHGKYAELGFIRFLQWGV